MTSARRASLALAHLLGDLTGELLGAQRLGQHDAVDRLVDDLLEARHVDAGLLRVEVDQALELGEVEIAGLGVAVAAGRGGHAQHLLDAAHADAGEADLDCGATRLDVGGRRCDRGGVGRRHSRKVRWPVDRAGAGDQVAGMCAH